MNRFFAPLCLLVSLACPIAMADPSPEQLRQLVESGQIVSLESIVTDSLRRHPGTLLEVELDEKKGRYEYELKVMDRQGRLWEMEYNAQNGQLLEEELDD